MNIKREYEKWVYNAQGFPWLKRELENISENQPEINDRFYRDLEFGTGGLRGKLGAGTNRMNLFTVGKATQGLAEYLLKNSGHPSVCIAYDTRNMSREFAERAAQVLCANGITVYLFDSVRPTPMLSFAVRYKKADAGVVITASHNPKEYNGYKVYGADGGQITDRDASEIQKLINECDIFAGVKTMPFNEAFSAGLLLFIGEDVYSPYYSKVKDLVIRKELVKNYADNLKIIYSPLHGAGNIPVRRVLAELGFSKVQVVKKQEMPDGSFPTVINPNPEDPSVFSLAAEMAKAEAPDLVFATDPDCDRIGVLVRHDDGEFHVLTGNQVGALLCDYIIRSKNELGLMPEKPVAVKTIVTSDLGKRICDFYGVDVREVLTGFKYIGELAEQWDLSHQHSFLFGYEESCGYLAGNFVRDKDAVIAAVLIAEMTLYYKRNGITLYQALISLFGKYGFFAEKLITATMDGKDGRDEINRIISGMRSGYQNKLEDTDLAVFEDYERSVRFFCKDGKTEPLQLPKSNVLKFVFGDGSWLVLRPSGTEPKIKVYLSAFGSSYKDSRDRLKKLESIAFQISDKIRISPVNEKAL
ncbi:MAG: phospho-sugar mutase [Bacillota bacterium]|nr:phospho-sugar mutase [Bacillota bacterium]